jgi:hypothetical protein
MGQLPGPPPDFAGLFNEPSIKRMLDELNDHQFEHFVKYVFEQTGYFVEDVAGKFGQDLDLKLYMGTGPTPTLYGGVSVKHFTPPDNVVTGPHMMLFHGAVKDKMQGYAVTTSTFNKNAIAEADDDPRIWMVDGEHFVLYIN